MTSEDPQATLKLCTNLPVLLFRDSVTAASIAFGDMHRSHRKGTRRPRLVLLDHGLYKELDFSTRINYATLWKRLVFSDAKTIEEYSAKLGAGEDLYDLFVGILTMRTWNRVVDTSVDHLVVQGTQRVIHKNSRCMHPCTCLKFRNF